MEEEKHVSSFREAAALLSDLSDLLCLPQVC